jgi:hypothetical protein
MLQASSMIRIYTLCITALLLSATLKAQPPSLISFDLKKPESYKEKPLGSEKMADKKFTAPRRFFQNNFTHYNYYYNANEKIKTVINNAKKQFKDNYTELLPFYNYTLDATKSQSTELDSVLDKTSTGILIHDLRNDWIDNLFLLMGKAYFYRKDFDSALMTFQYMNVYYQPGNKDDYTRLIGTNRKDEGKSAFTIATKEKRNTFQKIFTRPPSYNDALLWQSRAYIEMKRYGDAASLLEALRNDPNLPARLRTDYEELQAYYFYCTEQYDSSAKHLINALPNAANKNERGRWEFLIGQMLTIAGKPAQAQEYFNRSIGHTYDPVMDVYARLNQIALAKSSDKNIIQDNINELLKMAKREKYENYRGLIYFSAAKMEMQRNNFEGAQKLLLQSIKYSNGDAELKDKAYLYFGDIAFDKKLYEIAYNAYDSVGTAGSTLSNYNRGMQRKLMLHDAVNNLKRIHFEDSLQKIAAMPELERKAFLKKLIKQLRKEQGLKEDQAALDKFLNVDQKTYGSDLFNKKENQGPFAKDNTTYSGWYFGNQELKSRGFTAFKQKWGNRPNIDNWRRMEAVGNATGNPDGLDTKDSTLITKEFSNLGNIKIEDLTVDILEGSLPLTQLQLSNSNDTIQLAMLAVGKVYMNKIEDYQSAVDMFEGVLKRFDSLLMPEETYFNLYYCYYKLGNPEKSQYYKELLTKKSPNNKFAKLANKQNYVDSAQLESAAATKKYEAVYNAFIEGRFTEALKMKREADSLYGINHWTPQLLYIEAIYYIKEKQDSIAIGRLEILKEAFPDSALSPKAENLISVLKRRKEIEEYLTNLKIERAKEEEPIIVKDEMPLPPRNILKQDSATVKKPVINNPAPTVMGNNNPPPAIKNDSAAVDAMKKATKTGYSWNPNDTQYVALIMTKVDPVYGREAENAFKRYNAESYYNKQYQTSSFNFSTDERFMLIGPFANSTEAIAYMDKARQKAKPEIIPWLSVDKYHFLIFSKANLETLYKNNDLPAYRKFLQETVPGKF